MVDFTDYVAQGRELLETRNANSWALGDLAADFEVRVGRPTDPDAPTLSDLASAWDVETRRVSEWRLVSAFYPVNLRSFGDLSWSHYNMARRASNGDLEHALELLSVAQAQHMGVNAFRRYVSGTYFEGTLAVEDLPVQLQGMVPTGERDVWVTFGRYSAE